MALRKRSMKGRTISAVISASRPRRLPLRSSEATIHFLHVVVMFFPRFFWFSSDGKRRGVLSYSVGRRFESAGWLQTSPAYSAALAGGMPSVFLLLDIAF
jgi:hypothetical protein